MLFWKGGRSKSWKTGPLQTKPGQFRPSEEGFKPGFKQWKRFFKLFLKKSDNKLFGPSTLNYNSIRGFHITSPKFKLRNYLFFFFFLSFYFHEVLQHVKTFIYTNFRFQRVLRFASEGAWISRLLREAACSWRPRKLLFCLRTTLCESFLVETSPFLHLVFLKLFYLL